MKATLDRIKSFIDDPVSWSKIKRDNFLDEPYYPNENLWGSALPLTEDYFHPLNPCFLFELNFAALVGHADVITVRDGHITLMDFLLKNHQKIPYWNIVFLIPLHLEKLIPQRLKPYFLGYEFSQEKLKQATNAKFIYGYLSEEYLGENIEATLSKIDVSHHEKVTLFLSQERNLLKTDYDNFFAQKFIFELGKKLNHCQVQFINETTFINGADYSQYEFIDLARDNFLVSDNFVHFLLASRGCRSIYPAPRSERNPIHQLDMSLFHQMQIYEIETEDELFSEMLLNKKQNPHKEFLSDEFAKDFLRNLLQARL